MEEEALGNIVVQVPTQSADMQLLLNETAQKQQRANQAFEIDLTISYICKLFHTIYTIYLI